MSLDKDCIFCKILNGEIPSFKLYEDDQTFAFMDINPAHPGHVLVIPKFHSPNIFEIPPEWIFASMTTVQKLALVVQETLTPDGINIVQANGEGAAQSVQHFHIHVLPRTNGDGLKLNWGLNPGDMDDISAMAEKIKAGLKA